MIGFFIFIRFLLSTVPNEFYYSGNIIEAFVKPIENQITNDNIKVEKKYNVYMLLQFINNANESNHNILNTLFPHDNYENFQKKFMLTFVSHSDEKNLKCSLNELESFLAQCKSDNFLDQKHEIITMDLEFKDVSQIYEYPEDLKLGLLYTEDIKFDNFDYIDFLNNLNLLNNNEEIFKGLLCIILPFDSIFLKIYIDYLKFALNDLIDEPYFKLVTWTNLIALKISEHRQANFELLNRMVYEEHLMNLNNKYYEANSLLFSLKIKYIFSEREIIINYFKSKNISIWRIFQIEFNNFYTPSFIFIVVVFWKNPILLKKVNGHFFFDEHVYFIQQKTSYYKIIEKFMVPFYIPIDQPGMIFNKKNAIKLISKLNQTNQNITCEFEIQNENLKFKNFENFTINNNLYDKNNSINLKYRLDAQKDLEPEILYFKQYDIVFDGFPATESDQKQIDIKKFFQKYTDFVNMQISDLNLEFSNSNFDKVYLKYGNFVSMQSEIIEHKIHVNYDPITDFEIFEKVFDLYILNDTNSENNHFEANDNLIEVSFYSFDFDLKFYSLIENITLLSLQNIKNVNLILKSKDLGSYKNYLLKILNYRFFVHIKKQNVLQSQAIFFYFYEANFKEFLYFKKNVRNDNLLIYNGFIETDVKIITYTY